MACVLMVSLPGFYWDRAGFLLKQFKQETKKNNEDRGHRRFFFWIKIAIRLLRPYARRQK